MAASRIAYEAPSEIRDVISGIGRTEDIKLSPDNKQLAVVDYLDNRIFLFSIRIDTAAATPKITIFNYSEISSASLCYPHGVTFLGNDHIVFCNRFANVDVFRIPPMGNESHEYDLESLKSITDRI